MLREQFLRCREYEARCEEALGPIVSLLSAIQDEKRAERETAELVIRAQQETLSRINSNIRVILFERLRKWDGGSMALFHGAFPHSRRTRGTPLEDRAK